MASSGAVFGAVTATIPQQHRGRYRGATGVMTPRLMRKSEAKVQTFFWRKFSIDEREFLGTALVHAR